jgi:hypothetical protein
MPTVGHVYYLCRGALAKSSRRPRRERRDDTHIIILKAAAAKGVESHGGHEGVTSIRRLVAVCMASPVAETDECVR